MTTEISDVTEAVPSVPVCSVRIVAVCLGLSCVDSLELFCKSFRQWTLPEASLEFSGSKVNLRTR